MKQGGNLHWTLGGSYVGFSNKEHKWMLAKMQEHIREVNGMFIEERRRVQKRYKEYDGCYLGHYAQWFFWFFFVLGFFLFTSVIVMMVGKGLHWF